MRLALAHVGYRLVILLGLPAAGFPGRLFTIRHECGRGSFLRTGRANDPAVRSAS
jgi:omega-6 fatty acid desaturase (delta-12 desaturase)